MESAKEIENRNAGGGEEGDAMSNLRMLCNLMDFGARSRVETESRKSETKIESAKRAEAHKENFGGNFISFFFHGCVKMGASENVRSLYFPFALRHLHCHTMREGGGGVAATEAGSFS